MLIDQGTCFRKSFIIYGTMCNVDISQTGIESHNSLGLWERYRQPFRNTCREILIKHPHVPKEFRLAMRVKAMIDTLGPKGIASPALVFGEFFQIRGPRIGSLPRSNFSERSKVAERARTEMAV